MDNTVLKTSQIHSLENRKGLQYLLNEAYKIFGNPLLLHNMEYELIACTENVVTDDRLWNEAVENGVFSSESIEFFSEECFVDTVANTKAITLLTSDKLKYDRLYGRVFNCHNSTVADLIAVASDRPFTDQDASVFEAVCRKLSQEISSSEFFKNYGIVYHEKLICGLLDAKIGNKLLYSGHLSNLYEGLKENLFAIAVDIGERGADKSKLRECRDLLKEMQPELKYAVYDTYIVIVAGSDDETLDVKRDLHKLSGYFEDNNMRVGISGCFDNLFDLKKYYNQAVNSYSPEPA